ncbi:MAG: hypothetical protein B7Y85_12155 [Brevundimonas sp. 32-68-21]|jgi:hypothetical protein|nr:hypothetical protein [Brevundimonas sp.]OGN45975.1 MAG: hypothetical protein A3E24_04025 [Caulobacterales bacterium RIFCSPHIGHO2_12_FULL_68_13]OYX75171.1 MAG: hypothetical protein B7Y85_12155 [Brevundimonas sp. 32-68-21]
MGRRERFRPRGCHDQHQGRMASDDAGGRQGPAPGPVGPRGAQSPIRDVSKMIGRMVIRHQSL